MTRPPHAPRRARSGAPSEAPASVVGAGPAAWLLTDLITRLRRVLRAAVRAEYPWEALPMAQVELLQRLSDEPGLRVNDVASRHKLATNTVSVLVGQMVTAGLVERVTDPLDRRAVRLSITEHGAALLAGWSEANERRISSALEELDERDRSSVLVALPALSRLVDRLEEHEAAAAPHERPSRSP